MKNNRKTYLIKNDESTTQITIYIHHTHTHTHTQMIN